MLTRIVFLGVMGERFGKGWNLAVSSPSEALNLIDVNIGGGVKKWIRENLETYSHYRVICKYENGIEEDIDEKEYFLERKLVEIRFEPILAGAGAVGRIVVGAVLMIASPVLGPWAFQVGLSMVIGGVIEALTPRPHMDKVDQSERKDKTSYYFNGPVNTTQQGVPVPLIYGRNVLVGSHVVSAKFVVEDK